MLRTWFVERIFEFDGAPPRWPHIRESQYERASGTGRDDMTHGDCLGTRTVRELRPVDPRCGTHRLGTDPATGGGGAASVPCSRGSRPARTEGRNDGAEVGGEGVQRSEHHGAIRPTLIRVRRCPCAVLVKARTAHGALSERLSPNRTGARLLVTVGLRA